MITLESIEFILHILYLYTFILSLYCIICVCPMQCRMHRLNYQTRVRNGRYYYQSKEWKVLLVCKEYSRVEDNIIGAPKCEIIIVLLNIFFLNIATAIFYFHLLLLVQLQLFIFFALFLVSVLCSFSIVTVLQTIEIAIVFTLSQYLREK